MGAHHKARRRRRGGRRGRGRRGVAVEKGAPPAAAARKEHILPKLSAVGAQPRRTCGTQEGKRIAPASAFAAHSVVVLAFVGVGVSVGDGGRPSPPSGRRSYLPLPPLSGSFPTSHACVRRAQQARRTRKAPARTPGPPPGHPSSTLRSPPTASPPPSTARMPPPSAAPASTGAEPGGGGEAHRSSVSHDKAQYQNLDKVSSASA